MSRLLLAPPCLLVPLVFLSGCGDDAPAPTDAGLSADTGSPMDAGAPQCTALPEVVSTGLTAPADAGIDPGTVDEGTVVDFAPESVAQDDVAFPLGIQAGAMVADGALLWTRAVRVAGPVLRVWRDADTSGQVVLVHDAAVTPNADGYVHETVAGLAPATEYFYAFFVPGAVSGFDGRSPMGRFRTAFAPGSSLLFKVGATNCTGSAGEPVRTDSLPYPSLSQLAELELDALLHLGDMSYNDAATSLAQYRSLWARTLNIQGYRDVLTSTGMYITWDDHEVDDNWNPQAIPDARLAAAQQAFFETVPVQRGSDGQLWGSYLWGDTAEILVTDLRGERIPSFGRFISTEQMAFLKDRLLNSTAHFKLVFSSVHMSNLPGPWELATDDRWEGYDQRAELLDFIVDNDIDNVWFVAGDVHMGFVSRLEPEGHPYARMWEVTVGPGASAPNPLAGLIENGLVKTEDAFPCNQFVWFTGLTHVTTTLELDPLADTIRVRSVDTKGGEVLFDEVMQQEPRE